MESYRVGRGEHGRVWVNNLAALLSPRLGAHCRLAVASPISSAVPSVEALVSIRSRPRCAQPRRLLGRPDPERLAQSPPENHNS